MSNIFKCKYCDKESYFGFVESQLDSIVTDVIIKKYGTSELKKLMKTQKKRRYWKFENKQDRISKLVWELRNKRAEEFGNEEYRLFNEYECFNNKLIKKPLKHCLDCEDNPKLKGKPGIEGPQFCSPKCVKKLPRTCPYCKKSNWAVHIGYED